MEAVREIPIHSVTTKCFFLFLHLSQNCMTISMQWNNSGKVILTCLIYLRMLLWCGNKATVVSSVPKENFFFFVSLFDPWALALNYVRHTTLKVKTWLVEVWSHITLMYCSLYGVSSKESTWLWNLIYSARNAIWTKLDVAMPKEKTTEWKMFFWTMLLRLFRKTE